MLPPPPPKSLSHARRCCPLISFEAPATAAHSRSKPRLPLSILIQRPGRHRPLPPTPGRHPRLAPPPPTVGRHCLLPRTVGRRPQPTPVPPMPSRVPGCHHLCPAVFWADVAHRPPLRHLCLAVFRADAARRHLQPAGARGPPLRRLPCSRFKVIWCEQ
jgi:hypothetical protein